MLWGQLGARIITNCIHSHVTRTNIGAAVCQAVSLHTFTAIWSFENEIPLIDIKNFHSTVHKFYSDIYTLVQCVRYKYVCVLLGTVCVYVHQDNISTSVYGRPLQTQKHKISSTVILNTVHRLGYLLKKHTTFRRLDLFPSSGKGMREGCLF
jgi:hypothetical protein